MGLLGVLGVGVTLRVRSRGMHADAVLGTR